MRDVISKVGSSLWGASVVMVAALYAWRWGPHLDAEGNPPSSYDGADTFGFPFVSTSTGSGFCDDVTCSGVQTDLSLLFVNLGIGVLLIVGLAVVMAALRDRRALR